ncbi:MAG TPA: aminopeptidase P N-terminal domain-containing protein [Candidatus Acidoferrum sp.]|nr:aminopeptidase P N-terminal domain-containing protein [Candidatus Acidoferrum sp.]
MIRWRLFVMLAVFAAARQVCGADVKELKERRQRAATAFSDGVLLLHSATTTGFVSDGYREEAAFYYLTGLEDSPGAMLAIVGKSGESWLFVPGGEPKGSAETRSGEEAERKVGLDHVVDWKELQSFLTEQAKAGAKIYYKPEAAIMLPENLSATKNNHAPGWIQVLQKNFPTADFRPARVKLHTLMAVESGTERHDSEMAARATVKAFIAGARSIHAGASQREVELAVVEACWKEARGVSFWPWAMAGANSVFPKPFESESRYDHLDSRMRSGDLVRLDVGCEWQHYQGDLGRTIPVSGHFSDEQREVWNILVAAYQSVARELKEGLTETEAFDIWKKELLRHRESAKSALAQQAVERWSERKNVPYWQMHTMNLDAGFIEGPLRAGMVIDFEPIASIGGQGYYLEDMYLIGKDGATVMTAGLPYTAEEIEAFLAQKP